jgi:hypothetical protein
MSEKIPPAKMPAQFLKSEPTKLKDLPPGAEAFVNFAHVHVDLDGSVYVEADALIQDRPSFMTVHLREQDGGYILTLSKSKPHFKFEPRRLLSVVEYLPVVQIVEES